MAATATDSSVILAALLAWHERHAPARAALRAALNDLVVPAHALIEAYSVMTRLPQPHRLTPGDAFELLSRAFHDRVRLVALPPDAVWPMLDELAMAGIAGGVTYDARILAAARHAGATRLMTLNPRHFVRLLRDDDPLTIVSP